jgi:hypothetical protein
VRLALAVRFIPGGRAERAIGRDSFGRARLAGSGLSGPGIGRKPLVFGLARLRAGAPELICV